MPHFFALVSIVFWRQSTVQWVRIISYWTTFSNSLFQPIKITTSITTYRRNGSVQSFLSSSPRPPVSPAASLPLLPFPITHRPPRPVAHLFQAFWYRLWWLLPTAILAGLGEIIGWAGRLWSSRNVLNKTPFLMQWVKFFALILSPCLSQSLN